MNRTICKTIISVMLVTLLVCIAVAVQAKVPAEEVEKLKNELNPMGGEKAGNEEGTIPPWTGGLSKTPDNVKVVPGEFLPDPYPEDKILFTITAKNVDQYKDKLSLGLLKMFEIYPDSWKMNVYPTRRSAAFSEEIYQSTYDNALTAELVDRDGSMTNYWKGFVFPIPQNGSEAILNFLNKPNGAKNLSFYGGGGVVQENGTWTEGGTIQRWYYKSEEVPKEEFNPKDFTVGGWYELDVAGRYGEVFLRLLRGDYRDGDAGGWQYMPGQRRVRRAPNVFYDGVDPLSGIVACNDDSWMYSSKIDRFDWKLNGKKEMFVPYNAYRIEEEFKRDPKAVQTPYHINPKYMRWELHRVWEVVATIREGYRHMYGKRVFWLDEDSWQILLKDQYDNRGDLWRWSFANVKQYYDVPVTRQTQYFNFDSQTPVYQSGNFYTKGPPSTEDLPDTFFTIQHLRKSGRR